MGRTSEIAGRMPAKALNRFFARVFLPALFIAAAAYHGNASAGTYQYSGTLPSGDLSYFSSPFGVAVDGSGNLYVADSGNHRIQKFDPAGLHAGTLGVTGISGTDDSHFNYPCGVAADGSGNLYVADMGNDRIEKFDPAGAHVSTLGSSGTDNGHFNYPYGAAIYGSGNLHVADMGNSRIQKFSPPGVYAGTLGAAGIAGADNGHFYYPKGVAADGSGNVYVADTYNHRIQKFDAAGAYAGTFGETGVQGTDSSHFNFPQGVAVDGSGNVYVADTGNERIQKFDAAGAYAGTLGETGVPGTDSSHFNSPQGVAVDGPGNVYVADTGNERIQKLDAAGAYAGTLGETGVPGTDNSHFNSPQGVAVDDPGNLYVVDTYNHRVQMYDRIVTVTVIGGGGGSAGIVTGGSGVSCSIEASGTTSGICAEDDTAGTPISLTASPQAGSHVTWTGCVTSSGNVCHVTLNADTTVTATFILNQHTLTVAKTGAGSGTVGGGGTYDYGSVHAITATADAGSTFAGWTGDCSGTANPLNVTMLDRDMSCTAAFALTAFTISASVTTGGGTILCDPSSVGYGGSFQCSVVPASGYHLTGLADNLADVTALVSGNVYSVENVTSDHDIRAEFVQNSAVVSLSGAAEPYVESWYSSIHDAFAAASADTHDILLQTADFYEEPDFDHSDASILLAGGRNADFTAVAGVTVLHGFLTISRGTVTLENLVIQ